MYYLVIPNSNQVGCEAIIDQFQQAFSGHKLLKQAAPHDADIPIMLWIGTLAKVIKGSYFLSLSDDKEFKLDVLESMALEPYIVFMEHDTAWSYEMHQFQGTRSFFYTKPVLYDFRPEDNPPNAAAFEEIFGVPVKRIERYLRVWDWEMIKDGDELAYPTDDFPAGEWQQVEDFIKVLIGGITESYALEIIPTLATPDSRP